MYFQSAVLLLFLVLSSTVHSLNEGKLGDMKPAFVTARPGTGGSCSDAQIQKLRTGFSEAVEAIQKAAEAIDNLKKSYLLHISKDKRRTWVRQAQLLKALFNIDVSKVRGLGNDNADANDVQRSLQNIIDKLDYKKTEVAWQYWLFCGDDWLQWKPATTVNHLDDRNPQRTLGEMYEGVVDERAVDAHGNQIPGDVNGWQRGVNLARWAPGRAREAPDLYALFATAIYFDNFGWGTGVAATGV
ncbi:MAG: hypothetical protein Q9226_000741 [Calogaya cf. arnoldii]